MSFDPTDTILTVGANDTRPVFIFQLCDKLTGNPIDLSASAKVITMKFRARGSTTTLWTATAAKVAGGYAGQISITPPALAFVQTAGRYEGEIVVTDGTAKQTVLDLVKFKIKDNFS